MEEQQALAKTAEVLTEPAKEFLGKAAGTPGTEIGEIIGDRLRFRRWRNAVRMAERAQAFAAEHGIDPQQVPLAVLSPLLEGASLAEDDERSRRRPYRSQPKASSPPPQRSLPLPP